MNSKNTLFFASILFVYRITPNIVILTYYNFYFLVSDARRGGLCISNRTQKLFDRIDVAK